MEHYEHVTFTAEGKTRRVKLRITRESDLFLSGYEVDADAEEITGKDFERRLHLLDKTLITKRVPLRVNLKYGTLERAPQKPKARIHQNVWGNWNGYLGRRRVIEFGSSSTQSAFHAAQEWLDEQERAK